MILGLRRLALFRLPFADLYVDWLPTFLTAVPNFVPRSPTARGKFKTEWDLGCLPFDRKVRLGCRKHNGKRFSSLPQYWNIRYGLNAKKGLICVEWVWNREIGKWWATFRLVRTNRNEQTTSKRTPQFSVGISEKWPYHLPSFRNFRNFLSNGKHPWIQDYHQPTCPDRPIIKRPKTTLQLLFQRALNAFWCLRSYSAYSYCTFRHLAPEKHLQRSSNAGIYWTINRIYLRLAHRSSSKFVSSARRASWTMGLYIFSCSFHSDDEVHQSVEHTVWFHNLAHFPCLGTLFVHRETTPF